MLSKYTNAYPRYAGNEKFYDERLKKVIEKFKENYATTPRIFSAPGRTEIGGNHTDHQGGNVLCSAIDLDVLGGVQKNGTDMVNIMSEGYEKTCVDISNLEVNKDEAGEFSSLIRGIVARVAQLGYEVGGFDVYCTSLVLKGSGLSSSAAFEVFIGTAMNALFANGELSAVQIAQIGQYSENVYFDKPCGLMDQTASSVGGVIGIDFFDNKNPTVTKIEFDFTSCGHTLVIVDTCSDHADLTPEYAAIPEEMRKIAGFFGKNVLSEMDKATLLSDIKNVREFAGDRAVLRAIHFFNDCEYAKKEAECLKNNDFEGFLKYIKLSGHSSEKHLQNTTPSGYIKDQAVTYALALCEEFLGERGAFRVHGGGFAGTIQAFVPNEMVAEFTKKMQSAIADGCCHELLLRGAGGIELEVL